jgi:DNA invertase Pin-like site-specific DNA recombinase
MGRVDVVVVARADRLSRCIQDLAEICREAKHHNVSIESGQGDLPDEPLTAALMGRIDELERQVIRRRALRGK